MWPGHLQRLDLEALSLCLSVCFSFLLPIITALLVCLSVWCSLAAWPIIAVSVWEVSLCVLPSTRVMNLPLFFTLPFHLISITITEYLSWAFFLHYTAGDVLMRASICSPLFLLHHYNMFLFQLQQEVMRDSGGFSFCHSSFYIRQFFCVCVTDTDKICKWNRISCWSVSSLKILF